MNRRSCRGGALRALNVGIMVSTFIVFLVSSCGGGSDVIAHPLPPQENDFFNSNGKEIPIQVALDQVGILARAGVPRDSIESFMQNFNSVLIDSFPGGLYIFDIGGPLSRPDLVQFIRGIESEDSTLLKDAGLVIGASGTTTPMIVTDEFTVQFDSLTTQEEINNFNQANNVTIVRQNPFVINKFLLSVANNPDVDALTMSNQYFNMQFTVFSHPNFWIVFELFGRRVNDPLFDQQWHFNNTGQNGGTPDADIDLPQAWDITMGDASVVIAIIDNGFEIFETDSTSPHPDLASNRWVNWHEDLNKDGIISTIERNNIDNGSNGFDDDFYGWDFAENRKNPNPVTDGDNHGTALAGLAIAKGNNDEGISGVCTDCRFIALSVFSDCDGGGPCTTDAVAISDAIWYALSNNADIILCGWGTSNPIDITPDDISTALNAVDAAGKIIFFPGVNGNENDCETSSFSSLPYAIAVSSADNQDQKVTNAAHGECINILAPSHPYTDPPIAESVITTDRMESQGYNPSSPITTNELAQLDYTNTFSGTSAATAIAAGVAGLILSANDTLNRTEVERLLQDTADKIQPGVAGYSGSNGSSPTHSRGRINAFEAVRIVADETKGGKGGIDLFMRDNKLDWGNTERPSNVNFESPPRFIVNWQRSPDIKVDIRPFGPIDISSQAFESRGPEFLLSGDQNRVYVRVRNRGPNRADSRITVKLYWARVRGESTLPLLPLDFWDHFPENLVSASDWYPLDCTPENGGSNTSLDDPCFIDMLPYSGSSVANTDDDNAEVVSFTITNPEDLPSGEKVALLAIINSPQDPVSPSSRYKFLVDCLVPEDNNVALLIVRSL